MRDVILVLMLEGFAWFVLSMLFSPRDGILRRKVSKRDTYRRD